jgi:hypothetical protein
MTAATQTSDRKTQPIPPAPDDDQHDAANKMRKRFIAQLGKLPRAWQRWIIDDLDRKFPDPGI